MSPSGIPASAGLKAEAICSSEKTYSATLALLLFWTMPETPHSNRINSEGPGSEAATALTAVSVIPPPMTAVMTIPVSAPQSAWTDECSAVVKGDADRLAQVAPQRPFKARSRFLQCSTAGMNADAQILVGRQRYGYGRP